MSIIGFGGSSADAFGRGRVSSPTSLFNISFEYDAQPLVMSVLNVGAGTSAKTSNVSSVTLSTGGTTNGDGSIFQSHGYFRYESGKSQLIQMTGVIGAAKANVRSQIGYYDANNGMFFDQNNGMNVTVRTHTSGATVDTSVAQASWNLDKLDGSGSSGITLDFTKTQIFLIDLQWLGVGRVRFGFSVAGLVIYCHQILNANSLTLPYTNTGNLPIRWEIHNTGTAATTTSMSAICGSVISEGGSDNPNTYKFAASNGVTSISVSTRRTVLSIRPKTTFNSITNRGRIVPEEIKVLTSSGTVYWELVYNPTLTGTPSFTSVDANSIVEFDVANTTLTGGTVVAVGFSSGGGDTARGINVSDLIGILPLTLDIAGTVPDILSIVCTAFTGTVVTNAAAIWQEAR